jgi:phage-related protein
LAGTFKGAASTAANTASGQMKSLSIQMGEFKESIGAAILPLVEKMLPALQAFSTWAQENPKLITILAAAMGVLAASIVAVNIAMALNPFVAVAAAVAVLAAGLAYLWVKFDDLRPLIFGLVTGPFGLMVAAFVYLKNAADDVMRFVINLFKEAFNWAKNNWPLLLAILTGPFGLAIAFVVKFKDDIMNMFGLIYNGIKATMGFVADVITAPFKAAFKAVAGLWNNTVGKLSFTVPNWVPGIGGKGFDVPDIPMLAEGGIVNSATLAMIGESGPEAVIPLSKLGGMGGGSNITVNVTSANPDDVVAALQRWVRNNGSLALSTTAGVRF